MKITPTDLITWLIVGALAGPMIGLLVKGKKKGFGWILNLGVGLVGALIGGLLFTVVPILRPLASISINLEDLVAALIGCLIFLLLVKVVRMRNQAKADGPAP